MIGRCSVLILVVVAAYLAGCAPNPYSKAQSHYFDGDPVTAEEVLAPVSAEETEKDGKMKNLYLWDLGVYRFSQGDYDGAIECFMAGVKDVEAIHDAGETVGAMLSSSSSQKYVGDPVEISTAYLYLGMSFYMKGEYQNALIAFRRSIEEDLSKDEARQGDMAVTNFLMGETFFRVGKYDDAAVAYRRAVGHSADLVPAYVGMYHSLKKQGDSSEEQRILGEIEKRVDAEYFNAVTNSPAGQGISFLVMYGFPSAVKADELVGSFRKRDEKEVKAADWKMSCSPLMDKYVRLHVADNMHDHFKDQGGLGDEMKHQATRAVAATVMKEVPILGLFAPDTKADVRFWHTMPGYVHIGFYPAEPGTHVIKLAGYDKKGAPLADRTWSWNDIKVEENRKTLLILNACSTLCRQVE